MQLGLRGVQEHIQMRWGDFALRLDNKEDAYVEFNERTTKTRQGAKGGDVRAFPPRMYEDPDGGRFFPFACPWNKMFSTLPYRPIYYE